VTKVLQKVYSAHLFFLGSSDMSTPLLHKTGFKAWLPIIALAFAAFVFNTSEFLPVGLLPDIAESLHETVPFTGLILTGYAFVVAIMSLPLTIVTARFERRKLLLALLFIFSVCHFVVPWVETFWTLFAARVGVALTHAIFWSIMTPLAARVAPHGKRAVGLAAVMGGTIVATVLGVPIGTNLGHYFGWHMSFFIIGIGSALVFVVIYFVLPLCESTQAGSLKSLPVILKRPGLQQLYFLTVITVLGQFTAYSYLNPILATAGGLDEGMIVTMLFVFGIAGIIGTVIGSKTVDRHCAATLLISMAVVCVSLALLTVSAQATASLTFVVICWGAAMTAVCLAFQTVLLNVAPDAADVATSLYSGIFNVGIGGGAFIGSRVSQAAGFMPVAYVGAALVAVSLLSLVIVRAKSGRWLLGGTPTVREKGEPVHETP